MPRGRGTLGRGSVRDPDSQVCRRRVPKVFWMIDAEQLEAVDVGDLVGDADVVLLGEATHGDGSGMLAFIDLVRRLHVELGFSTLAFESPEWCAERAWRGFIAGDLPPGDVARDGLFPMWSKAQEMTELWQYLADHATAASPLRLRGIDWQVLRSGLPSLVEAVGDEALTSDELVAALRSGDASVRDGIFARWLAAVETNRPLAELVAGFAEGVGWRRRLTDGSLDRSSSSDRDRWMGNRVLHQFERTAEKTIVWAASYHSCPTAHLEGDDGDGGSLRERTSMGDVIRASLGARVSIISLTAGGGTFGAVGLGAQQVHEVDAPAEGSLEAACRQRFHHPTLLRAPTGDYNAGPLGYSPTHASWSETLDGFLYVPEMRPPTLRSA